MARALLVGALLVGGIAWAVTRHSGSGHPAAAPSTSPSPSPSIFTVLPGRLTEAPPVSVKCDPASGCQVSRADLGEIEAAVLAHLPQARLSQVSTTVRSDHGTAIGLAERILDAHIDSVDVLLRIRPYQHPEPAPTVGITPTPPGLGSAFFRFTTAAFVVDVQWTGTDANPPPVANLEALADDPRLEALN